MTIADMREKCKAVISTIPRDLLIISVLVVASTASFWLGYLAGRDVGQGSGLSAEPSSTPLGTLAEVVASRTGTKYYRPECPGVAAISEKNRVWFVSSDLARTQGYEPADNCDGI